MKRAGLTPEEARCVEAWTDLIDAKLTVRKTGSGYRYKVESWDILETFSKDELVSNAKETIYEWAKGDGIEFIMEATGLTEDEINAVITEMEA